MREVSHAVASDAPALARLLGGTAETCEHVLGTLATLPLSRALIVRKRGWPVAYLELHARPTAAKGWEARIATLALDPDDAPVRAGRMVISAAETEAVLLGCERVVLEPGAATSEVAELAPAIGLEAGSDGEPPARAVAFGLNGSPVERFLRCAARGAAEVLGIVGAGAGQGSLDDRTGASSTAPPTWRCCRTWRPWGCPCSARSPASRARLPPATTTGSR